jgi:hypothetical protein
MPELLNEPPKRRSGEIVTSQPRPPRIYYSRSDVFSESHSKKNLANGSSSNYTQPLCEFLYEAISVWVAGAVNSLTCLTRFSYTLRCRGFFFFFILIILQTVGLLERVISSSQGLYLNTGQHKHRINTYIYQTSMSCVGFGSTIPASERSSTPSIQQICL